MHKIVEEKGAQLEALQNERKAILDELLGPNHRSLEEENTELEQLANRKQALDFLAPEKVDACVDVESRFQKLRQDLGSSPMDPKQRQARIKELANQEQEELTKLLSPGDLAEYNLRKSRFAETRLAGFDTSEYDLRQIVAIQEKYAT